MLANGSYYFNSINEFVTSTSDQNQIYNGWTNIITNSNSNLPIFILNSIRFQVNSVFYGFEFYSHAQGTIIFMVHNWIQLL